MEDIFDGAWRKPAAASDRALETELARLVDVHGLALVARPARLEAALSRACPDATSSIMLLLDAATAGVAARLGEADDRTDMPALLATCVVALRRHGVVDAERARWAVHTWAYAFAFALPADAPVDEATATSTAPIEGPADAHSEAVPAAPEEARAATPDTPPREFVDARDDPGYGDATPHPEAPTTAFPHTVFASAGSVASTAAGAAAASTETPRRVTAGSAAASMAAQPAQAVPLRTVPDRVAIGPRSRTLTGVVVACVVAVPLVAVLGFAGWRWFEGGGSTTPNAAATPEPSSAAKPATERVADDAPSITTPVVPPAPPRPPEGAATSAGAATPAAPALAIARVDVPRVVAGAPFAIVVRAAGNVRDVVAIERVFRDAVGSWPRSGTLTLSTGLRRTGDAFIVPFRAIDAPARATIVFTAVGRDGTRSEPRAAQVVVAGEDTVAPGASAADASIACTVSTCGRVVETREASVDARTQSTLYEVAVELDDHRRLTFTAPWRPPTGTRMRATAGGTFLPLRP